MERLTRETAAPTRCWVSSVMRSTAPLLAAPPAARGAVTVSQERLNEFLDAEFRVLARGGYSSITLNQILGLTCLERTARVIQRELPARFAVRIQQIESTTKSWSSVPGLARLHDCMRTSFTNLRLVEFDESGSLEKFSEVILDLRERHVEIPMMLRQCAVELKARGIMDDTGIHEWLLKFMNSRLGTEMLTKHYIAMLRDPDLNHIGIIDTKCEPARICQEAIEHVQTNLPFAAGVDITLQVAQLDIEFSFISTYLFWIIVELLTNSVMAVHKRRKLHNCAQDAQATKDVKVTVCADSSRVGIRISDKGMGVPFANAERVWEYMFTTSDMEEREVTEKVLTGPLCSTGMGLPNCGLYARYLGGSIDLMSMPGNGTDVYLFFSRVDARSHSSLSSLSSLCSPS